MVTLWLITGINVGLALANVMIAVFNVRLFRSQSRYLQMQTDFYRRNTPDFPAQTGGSSRTRM